MSTRLDVNICARVGGFALEVAWSAGDGVTVLFGPSGSGKTLTLQCLAGLVRPDSGRIVLDGHVLFDAASHTHVSPQERRLGYVFQGYALFPHLTVGANLAFGLRDRPPAERTRRARDVSQRLGLIGLEDRFPRELSGGQKQRVALGRALATEPALLLLDEPLSALDLPLRRALRDELLAILEEWRVPAVLVTHDFAEAYQLGDRVVIYEAGKVQQSAPRADLLWRPASESVARILGLRNILHGTIQHVTPERIGVSWRGHTLEALNSPVQPYLPDTGSPVAFFIRPEDLRLIRKDGSPPDPAHHGTIFSGSIIRDVDLGATRTLMVRLDVPGPAAQGEYDLEIEVPRFVHQVLHIEQDRHWEFSVHRGSVHILPS